MDKFRKTAELSSEAPRRTEHEGDGRYAHAPNINILFCIGGDGTLCGARDIAAEVRRRKQPISIIGIPKTIDNDLNLVDRTFGFETAVLSSCNNITSAHTEANGASTGWASSSSWAAIPASSPLTRRSPRRR